MRANIKKAWYYCRRNGLANTFFAALERVLKKDNIRYEWKPLKEAELEKQRRREFAAPVTFSILVPAYETNPLFLRQMIDSLTEQTYPHWELVIADASVSDTVENVVKEYTDRDALRIEIVESQKVTAGRTETSDRQRCIVYKRLQDNRGISHNTNEALQLATGDYIGLLDHDDVLTPDALYEMAVRIEEAEQSGQPLQLLYSDEDKCDMDMTHFYEPHFKEEFNLDLILSNNYICHFLVMEAELMKQVRFNADFDGAQDYKLVLDAVAAMIKETGNVLAPEQLIAHIPKVLYHWRCHTGSTAQNPQSKLYAYEAGKRAVQSFCESQNWHDANVQHLQHLGFYKVVYGSNRKFSDMFRIRQDVAAVGGSILHLGFIRSGGYNADGTVCYKGLFSKFSGYMHKAVLTQDAYALDLRCIVVREELKPLLQQIKEKYGLVSADIRKVPEKTVKEAGLEFAKEVHARGYRLIWNPDMKRKL